MKEFLDKTGLEYFYNKLCSVFYMKGLPVKTNITADLIATALGFNPISLNDLNGEISNINVSLNNYSTNFGELKDKVTTIGTNVDTNTSTIALYGSYIDDAKTKLNQVLTIIDAQDAVIQNLTKSYDDTTLTLSVVATQLDALNSTLDNIVARTNSQGVALAQIRQLVTDAEASIDLTVSMQDVTDTVTALIQEKVFNDDGTLKSSIALKADLISIGNIGSNITFEGTLSAPSGTIGGWTIGSDSINGINESNYNNEDEPDYNKIGTSIMLDSATPKIISYSYKSGVEIRYYNPIIIDSDGIGIGSTSTLDDPTSQSSINCDNYIKSNGSGSLASGNFTWDTDGNIETNSITFTDPGNTDYDGSTMTVDSNGFEFEDEDYESYVNLAQTGLHFKTSSSSKNETLVSDSGVHFTESNNTTDINESGVTFYHSTLNKSITMSWKDIYNSLRVEEAA